MKNKINKFFTGSFTPFQEPVFLSLWIASFISNIGTWMQNIAVGWIGATMSSSIFMISLIQVAVSLPSLFVSYPAGVISDHTNRRTWLIWLQFFLFFIIVVLSFLTFIHLLNIFILIIFSFLLGIGGALSAPVWQAVVPEIISKSNLKNAIALNGLNFNLARAIGPALGGVLLIYGGIQSIFLFNAISFIALIAGLYNWRNKVVPFKPKHFSSEFLEGIEAIKNARSFKSLLFRTLSFTFFVSIIFAILPHLSKYEWHQTSGQYTLLWCFMGLGALFGSLIFNRLTNLLPAYLVIGISCDVVACCIFFFGFVSHAFLIESLMFLTGVGWICITSMLNIMAQLYSPDALKGRFLAMNITVFQGSFAISSMLWGYLSDIFGATTVITIAGCGMVLFSSLLMLFPITEPDLNDNLVIPCTEPLILIAKD